MLSGAYAPDSLLFSVAPILLIFSILNGYACCRLQQGYMGK